MEDASAGNADCIMRLQRMSLDMAVRLKEECKPIHNRHL